MKKEMEDRLSFMKNEMNERLTELCEMISEKLGVRVEWKEEGMECRCVGVQLPYVNQLQAREDLILRLEGLCGGLGCLREMSIIDILQYAKTRERDELLKVVRQYGKRENNVYRYEFTDVELVIAADVNFEPCGVIVRSVEVRETGNNIVINANDANNQKYEYEIYADDVFEGHLESIASTIRILQNENE